MDTYLECEHGCTVVTADSETDMTDFSCPVCGSGFMSAQKMTVSEHGYFLGLQWYKEQENPMLV